MATETTSRAPAGATVADYGYDGAPVPFEGACPARVLGTWGDYYRVVCDAGEGVARKKASAFRGDAVPPTTGDFVALRWNPDGESRILATLPRRSTFERAAAGSGGRRSQTIAVNFDVLFFLTSANRNFSVRRLERFLSLARARSRGAEVAALITKCDLVDDEERERLLAEARAHSPGVPVMAISSRTGFGLDALAPFVQPRRTLAFIGSSGVGKSSLVNALAGDAIMPTMEIRDWDSKGRHATTERELVRLPCGAMVIDTPGMREIGLWEADDGISDAFSDVEALFKGCRFSDCRHDTEPGCAVKAALADGSLSPERWTAYRRLKAEAAREEERRVEATHRYRK